MSDKVLWQEYKRLESELSQSRAECERLRKALKSLVERCEYHEYSRTFGEIDNAKEALEGRENGK